jgi:hypothetical protein
MVCLAQGLALGVVVLLIGLGEVFVGLGVPTAVVGIPLGLGLAPAVVHNRLMATRWRPVTSLRATIMLALGGVVIGHFLGAHFFESGHLRGGGASSVVGAVLGCITLLFIANCRVPRR